MVDLHKGYSIGVGFLAAECFRNGWLDCDGKDVALGLQEFVHIDAVLPARPNRHCSKSRCLHWMQ